MPVRDLADDYYDYDEKNYCLIGRRNNNRYRLGDKVQVQIARANLDKKQLDFVLVDEKHPPRSLDSIAAPSINEVMKSSGRSKKSSSSRRKSGEKSARKTRRRK